LNKFKIIKDSDQLSTIPVIIVPYICLLITISIYLDNFL